MNKSLILRCLICAGLLFLAGWLILPVLGGGGGGILGGMVFLLFGFGALLLAVIVMCPELVGFASAPFFRFIDSIYMPGGYHSRPPLDYRLARKHSNSVGFATAIEKYERISRYYPEEFEPYEKRIELNLLYAGDEAEARHVFKRAKHYIKDSALIAKLEDLLERESPFRDRNQFPGRLSRRR